MGLRRTAPEVTNLHFILVMLWSVEGSSHKTGSGTTLGLSYENRLVPKLKIYILLMPKMQTLLLTQRISSMTNNSSYFRDYPQSKLNVSPKECRELHGRSCCRATWEDAINSDRVNKSKKANLNKDSLGNNGSQVWVFTWKATNKPSSWRVAEARLTVREAGLD